MQNIGKTVRISEQTYNKLSKLGNVNNTFDDVISKLLEGVDNR